MHPTNARPHVVIVGGGIAGLAAAFFLRDEPVRVTVLEGSPRLGGKLSVSEVAGVAVDEGAEALLVTAAGGHRADRRAGLGGERVEPGTTSSAIWTLGALRPLPPAPVHGRAVRPGRAGQVRGAVQRRSRPGRPGPRAAADRPATATCRSRGTSEPGSARRSSTGWSTRCSAACTPDVRRSCPSTRRCRRCRPPRGSYRSLAEAAGSLLPAAGSRAQDQPGGRHAVRADRCSPRSPADWARCPPSWPRPRAPRSGPASMARELSPGRTGDRLAAHGRIRGGPGADRRRRGDPRRPGAAGRPAARGVPARRPPSRRWPRSATPAWRSSRWPTRAPPSRAPGLAALGWSGYLVPAVDGRAVKAVTFSTVKWPHLADVDGTRRRAAGDRPVLGRPHRRGSPAAARRRRSRRAGRGRARGGDRGTRRAGRHPRHPLGRRRCPSTRSGTWTGWRGSARRSRPSRAWPSAARPTTGSAYPPASATARRGQPGHGLPRGQALTGDPAWCRAWPTIVAWLTNTG